MKKDKAQRFIEDAINKMMEIAGHDVRYDDLPKEKDPLPQEEIDNPWYIRYTMTEVQYEEWRKWFISECARRITKSKKRAEKEFTWFSLGHGLRVIK